MQQATTFLLLLTTLLSSHALGSALPADQLASRGAGAQWQVTNFEAHSGPGEAFVYRLDVEDPAAADGAGSRASCQTSNAVTSSDCAGAFGPAAFDDTICSAGGGPGSLPSDWSWSLQDARSGAEGAAPGFSLRITYSGATPTLYGCRFIDFNTTCATDPNNPNHVSESLVVPSAFTLTAQESSECIFA